MGTLKDIPFSLKHRIFCCFLYNCDFTNSNQKKGFFFDINQRETFKYDELPKLADTYKFIDFQLSIEKFIQYVEIVAGHSFAAFYRKCVLRKDTTPQKIKKRKFNSEIWDIFLLRLKWCPKSIIIPIGVEQYIINCIVHDWLIEIEYRNTKPASETTKDFNIEDAFFDLDDINTNVKC